MQKNLLVAAFYKKKLMVMRNFVAKKHNHKIECKSEDKPVDEEECDKFFAIIISKVKHVFKEVGLEKKCSQRLKVRHNRIVCLQHVFLLL